MTKITTILEIMISEERSKALGKEFTETLEKMNRRHREVFGEVMQKFEDCISPELRDKFSRFYNIASNNLDPVFINDYGWAPIGSMFKVLMGVGSRAQMEMSSTKTTNPNYFSQEEIDYLNEFWEGTFFLEFKEVVVDLQDCLDGEPEYVNPNKVYTCYLWLASEYVEHQEYINSFKSTIE